jgi:hypothetical protein
MQDTKRLSIRNTRTLRMAEDVLSVRLSPDSKFLAVALLDSTIKVGQEGLKYLRLSVLDQVLVTEYHTLLVVVAVQPERSTSNLATNVLPTSRTEATAAVLVDKCYCLTFDRLISVLKR